MTDWQTKTGTDSWWWQMGPMFFLAVIPLAGLFVWLCTAMGW